jgi:hypothetical protein
MVHPTPEDFSRKTPVDHSLTSVPGSKPQTATRMEQNLPPTSAHPFRSRSKSLAYGTLAWQLQMPRYSLGSYPLDGGFDGFPANMGGGTGTCVPFKANSWEPTLEKAIKAIVSIKASHVRSFDSETSGKSGILLCLAMSTNLSFRQVRTLPPASSWTPRTV